MDEYCLELAHTDWGAGACGAKLNGALICPENATHIAPKGAERP